MEQEIYDLVTVISEAFVNTVSVVIILIGVVLLVYTVYIFIVRRKQ